MKYSRTALLLAMLLALAGCADQPLSYNQPPDLTAQTGASITGSLVKTGALANNEKVFVSEVDNAVIPQGGDNLSTPVLVTPGLHVLQVTACECGLWLKPLAGNISIAVDLKAGQSYVARAGIPASEFLLFDPSKTTMAWLEDGSGKPVVAPQQITLVGPPQPMMVPIFIPAR